MKLVIVEDEPVLAQRLQRQIAEILGAEKYQTIHFDNLDDAQQYLAEHAIDLLLLDLNLHGRDGFALLKSLVAESFQTIVISAYAEKAIQAFEYGVLDFVAKPYNIKRLEKALARWKNQNQRGDYAATRLAIKTSMGITLVEIDDISFLQADGHYTKVMTLSGDEYLHSKSIEKLTAILPQAFERIHRSYIVNMNFAKGISIESGGIYKLQIQSKPDNHIAQELPLSRTYYAKLKSRFSE